jgi:hypothetical protein
MEKYRIVAVLLTPNGNYDEKSSPKAVADFNALESAWEKQDIDTMLNILTDYCILNGAIEEHDSNADIIVDCDADGFYLLRKISEPKTINE